MSNSLDKLLGHHVRLTLSPPAAAPSSSSPPAGSRPARQLTGKLWAYDPSLGAVALETSPEPLPTLLASAPAAAAAALHATRNRSSPNTSAPASTGFKIVKISEIKKVEFIPSPQQQQQQQQPNSSSTQSDAAPRPDPTQGLTPTHPVSLAVAQAREAHAVKQSLTKAAKLGGKEVSEIGQLVFDALSKTLPCRWHGSHIIVLDEVVISGPGYDPASTNVPNLDHQQLRSFVDGTNVGPIPNGAQAKANSWNRVVKVLEGERRKILANQTAQ
ncbi:uncharacterized protein PFL1_05796 [Pseudozyma flocculosa PF-1]|uniref:AD domain-containing protein n=2 Tax=Pseudozyma flocculosa TaxID=84751 RepID=A0A5C3F360_9BASI|nr:uncharacterized protein PFL1_05796 [Pseudozyma flocculosa PF-1]EPQ26474.1 hypothetical protein PFL1_05796 [Pseudozyma flocculosa PF-1]SPO38540.1 uncharacterized protein PSFLO_04018 [Pseudozyma flocculosa]